MTNYLTCIDRLSTLAELYGGWFGAFCHGVEFVRELFPKPGISCVEPDPNMVETAYPGDQTLYEFIVSSAHPVEDMIKL